MLTEALTTANPGQFLVLSCSLFSLEQNEEFRLCLLYHKCALSDMAEEGKFLRVNMTGQGNVFLAVGRSSSVLNVEIRRSHGRVGWWECAAGLFRERCC